ncbi:MAG: tetratricopeptide (TPR) repeat protein [Paraglaciecola sp.]|jgi:tetratricopeptide (TPR) repeat protein
MTILNKLMAILCIGIISISSVYAQGLKLIDVVVESPNLNKLFLQREAKISVEEYPLAEQLKLLLQKSEYLPALRLLNEYEDKKSPALLLVEGQLLMQTEQWQQAESRFKQVLLEMPDLLRGHLALSTLYHRQEDYQKAQTSLSKAISLGASDANQYALLGYLHMQNNDPHSAVAAYQYALMLNAENDDIRKGLLFALINSQQINAARNLLAGMLAREPENSQLWLQRTNLAMQASDEQLALSSIEAALRLGEQKPSTKILAMKLHLKQKSYSRALVLSIELLNDKQLSFSEADKLLGWLALENQWAYVQQILDNTSALAATASFSETSRLLYYKAQLAWTENDLIQAEKIWKQAIQIDAGNGDALLALATLSISQNRYAQAELYYQRAETLEDVKLSAMLGRAQLYIEQLDYMSALTLLHHTLSAYPHRHDLQKNIRILTNLVNSQDHSQSS